MHFIVIKKVEFLGLLIPLVSHFEWAHHRHIKVRTILALIVINLAQLTFLDQETFLMTDLLDLIA